MLMDLFIETLTGVSFELHVSPAETVMSIKSKIQRAEGIPVSQQHLIWQNDELDDHRRLRDYAISEGSTLRLVLGLRGGPLNAHRIPPLRLTPIQLAPSTPPNKYGSNSMSSNKFNHFSGSTSDVASHLPISKTSLFPNDLRQSRSNIESTLIDRMLNPLRKMVTSMQSDINDIMSKSNIKQESSDDEVKRSVFDDTSDKSLPLRTPHDELKQGKSAKSLNLIKEEVSDDESQLNSDEKSVITRQLKSGELVEVSKATSSDLKTTNHDDGHTLDSQKPNDYDKSNDQDQAIEYPPLLRSREESRPFYMHWTSREPLSSWRLCATHDTITSSSNMRETPVLSKVDKVSRQDKEQNSSVNQLNRMNSLESSSTTNDIVDSGDKLDKTSDSVSTSAAAATLLATLLTATGDHSTSLPSQATRVLGRLRYPYHWLRKPSPLPEDNEHPHPFITTGFWDAEDCDDDRDTVAANVYGAESDPEDDDLDEDENSDTKEAYCCGGDDDDSLADLEDYLFYYRTGDLLFGPPSISTGYAPYSCYAIRDSYDLGHWNTDLEHDLTGIKTTNQSDMDSNLQNETAWRHEYNQLTEKVKNLKTRMKNARARRCKQNSKTVDIESSEANLVEPEILQETQKESGTSDDKQGNFQDLPVLSSSEVSKFSLSSPLDPSLNNSEKKQRRRRFGTVTPPDVKFLIQMPSNNYSSVPSNSDPSVLPPEYKPSSQEDESKLNRPRPGTHSPVDKTPNSPSNSRKSVSTISPITSTPFQHASKSNSPKSSTPELNSLTKLTLGNETYTSTHLSNSEDQIFSRKISTADSKISIPSSQFLPALVTSTSGIVSARLLASSEGRLRVSSRLIANNGIRELKSDIDSTVTHTKIRTRPRTPPGPNISSSTSVCRKRCALCLRRIGLVNSYSCRCGRNFCARHRYAEVHSCPFDYKSEARRYLMESNPVVTAPKLPKI